MPGKEVKIDAKSLKTFDIAFFAVQTRMLMFPVNDLQAARGGDADQIAMLARQGANLDQVYYDGRTAMHKSCLEGNHKCVEVLIQNYADVNIKDRWGQVTLELSSKSSKFCK